MLYGEAMATQGRRPQNRYSKDGQPVNAALRFLREDRGLTRPEVVELAHARGGELSDIYLTEVERQVKPKKPSEEKLDVILAAIGVDRAALEQTIAEQPWKSPTRDARPKSLTKSDLKTSGYYQAVGSTPPTAEAPSGASVRRRSASTSRALAPFTDDLIATPAFLQCLANESPENTSLDASPADALSFGAAAAEKAEASAPSEIAEITDAYPRLTRPQQLTVLGMVRSYRG